MNAIDILYEDGPCLAVGKPAGLLTQAPHYLDSLERRVKEYLKQRDQKTGRVYLGMPQRLDRPVSGILVMARHERAAKRLSDQFERRMVDKKYWALLEGELEHDQGTWIDTLRKVPGSARAETVSSDHPDGREAILRYEVRERRNGCCLVEVRLETGRYHQIRLQAAGRGHPVVGDRLYGAAGTFGPACDDQRRRAIALHARQLSFYHPMTYQLITIAAPLPTFWPACRECHAE